MRIFRFFGRLSVRLVFLLLLAGVVVGQGWLPIALGWLAFGYLIWRAWPAVRSDLHSIWFIGGRVRGTREISRF